MLVCHCVAANDRRLRAAIAAGADDVAAIGAMVGAGSFCGGCRPAIVSLLAEVTGQPASALEPTLDAGSAPGGTVRPSFRTVARALEEEVLASGWVRDEPLGPAAALQRHFGCTRGTLERASWVLEQHGIVTRAAGEPRPLRVGRPSARAIAEGAALHLAVAGASRRQVLSMRRRIEEAVARRSALDASDPRRTDRLRRWLAKAPGEPRSDSLEFHLAVAEAAGNPALRILSEALLQVARLHAVVGVEPAAGRPSGPSGARPADVRAAHEDTARAILDRDPELAAARMRAHIDALQGRHVADSWWLDHPSSAPMDPFGLALRLAADIRRRGLAPGAVVTDRRRMLEPPGVGRDLLRRAVTLLEYYAVAAQRPGPDGAIVVLGADPWPAAQLLALYLDAADPDVDQVFDVRLPIERAAAARAARSRTVEGIALLERRLQEEAHVRARLGGDRPGHHDVHTVIGDVGNDPVLRLFVYGLKLFGVRRAQRAGTTASDPAYTGRLARDHDAIVRAIIAGDARAARAGMEHHLTWMRSQLPARTTVG